MERKMKQQMRKKKGRKWSRKAEEVERKELKRIKRNRERRIRGQHQEGKSPGRTIKDQMNRNFHFFFAESPYRKWSIARRRGGFLLLERFHRKHGPDATGNVSSFHKGDRRRPYVQFSLACPPKVATCSNCLPLSFCYSTLHKFKREFKNVLLSREAFKMHSI